VRFAFDQLGIPYTYLGDQTLGRAGALDRFDVVVYPHVNGTPGTILAGRPRTGPPIPWRRTAQTPHLGRWDQTDDLRPGSGSRARRRCAASSERGGLLVTEGGTTRLPVELGFAPTVSAVPTTRLRAQGTVLRAQAGSGRPGDSTAARHPALYGYERATLPLLWVQGPAFAVQPPDTTGRDALVAAAVRGEVERARARVLLRWHDKADSLLVSGLLAAARRSPGAPRSSTRRWGAGTCFCSARAPSGAGRRRAPSRWPSTRWPTGTASTWRRPRRRDGRRAGPRRRRSRPSRAAAGADASAAHGLLPVRRLRYRRRLATSVPRFRAPGMRVTIEYCTL
jgi:hypothetical protein